MGPGPVPVTLMINGRKHQLTIEPRDAARRAVQLPRRHRLKRVCDRGTCGACTAIVDGTGYACTMLAVEAQGKPIRTAEGLVQGDELDPCRGVRAHDAQQCGFCTPGFVCRRWRSSKHP